MKTVDTDYMVDLLTRLCKTPSPTGNSDAAVTLLEEEFRALGIATRRTNKGALIATLPGLDGQRQRTLSGHVDTLGAMVREIKQNGRLGLTAVGGYMWNAVEGEHCLIEAANGRQYTGTILTTKPSTHVWGAEAGKQERSAETMEVRLDERVRSREDTEKLGIRVGDFVAFDPRTEVTPSGFIKSRHLDDKAGCACLLGAAKCLVDNGLTPAATTNFFISNYEEVGHGAAGGWPAETVEFIAVDMGCIGEGLNGDEYSVSIAVKDSSGPYHLGLRRRLVELAEAEGISYKLDVFPYYGSDASAALRAGADIMTACIGPGVDASHAHERTHRDGLEATARLCVAYMLK